MLRIQLKTEKSFIAHPWCLLSVVGLEEYSAHDWRAATSVQRAPVTWREWGLWFGISECVKLVSHVWRLAHHWCRYWPDAIYVDIETHVNYRHWWIVKFHFPLNITSRHSPGLTVSVTGLRLWQDPVTGDRPGAVCGCVALPLWIIMFPQYIIDIIAVMILFFVMIECWIWHEWNRDIPQKLVLRLPEILLP